MTMKTTALMAVLTVVVIASAGAETPPIPNLPAAVDGVLYARSFVLEESFPYDLRKERPNVSEGTLLVLEADKDLLLLRPGLNVVLYVGDQTAERLNPGDKSGRVVVLVPGKLDLASAPIWFGPPRFMEQVDQNVIKAEREAAEAAGIGPLPADRVRAALSRGGGPIHAKNLRAVLRSEAAELILKYSPEDKHIADGFRVPDVQRKTKTETE